jgi:hypothetical protein
MRELLHAVESAMVVCDDTQKRYAMLEEVSRLLGAYAAAIPASGS